MPVDLNETVRKLHDGTSLSLYEVTHQHDLMKRFILEMAKGPYNTTKLGFYHTCEDRATKLAQQLWPEKRTRSRK